MRGKLKIELVCPSGTRSVIGARRKKDNSRDGLHNWTFSTVRCWGEDPVGVWQLIITDFSTGGGGVLEEWTLAVYGSNMKPEDVAERKAVVAESYGGEFLDTNLTEPCSFYWATPIEEETYLSMKTIKFLLLISAFATVLALYYSLEQAFCTDDEKKNHATKLGLDKPSRGHGGENQELLEEQNIPMVDLTCDLTSVDLQEVTADMGQGSAVDPMYTCRVPVLCIEVDEEDFGEDLGRSRVTGEGYLTNVQSGVCSDSQKLTDPARNECVSVQPAGANIQRTGIDLLPYVPHQERMESSDSPRCPASPKKVSPEIQAAASQLARLDEVPVNQPTLSHDTDVQPHIQTACTEKATLLVNSIEGSSIQPTKLPETLHSNLDIESGNKIIIAPSMFTSDSTDSAPRHILSSDKFVDLASDVPLVHSANGIKEQAITNELLNQRAIVLDKSQGYPLEWDAAVLTNSSKEDWTTPTFDAFQPVSKNTATSESDEIISSTPEVDVRCQTPPFLSH